MLPFSTYINEACVDAPYGIYVKMNPTTHSILTIQDRIGMKVADDLHCTLVYSKQPAMHVMLPFVEQDARFEARGVEIVRWAGHEGAGYVVLLLDSPELQALNQDFQTAGLIPTFPDYKPHVTLFHPAEAGVYDDFIREQNELLAHSPMELTFYYGGYNLLDEDA